MSKFKFKIGDRVRILDGSNIDGYIGGWCGYEMVKHVGHVYTVENAEKRPQGNCYRMKGFPVSRYVWDERGLEPFVLSENIVIFRKGSKVTAKNTFTGKTGVAKCSPDDEFDYYTGARIALDRLFDKEISVESCKPKLLNCKFTVNKSYASLTAGKIYTVKNGKFKNNYGDWLPLIRSLHTFSDLEKYFGAGGGFSAAGFKVMEILED